jgi:hypothetical protein
MSEEGWREQFRVEEATEKKEIKTEIHRHFDNGRCLRAKGFKCLCKCCGEHHGALTRKDMSPLESFAEIDPPKLSQDYFDIY